MLEEQQINHEINSANDASKNQNTSDKINGHENVLLEIKHLKKTFDGSTLVTNDVDFTVKKGEVISLLGPSGCGKTTLLSLIAGFEKPNSGFIKVGDRVLYASKEFLHYNDSGTSHEIKKSQTSNQSQEIEKGDKSSGIFAFFKNKNTSLNHEIFVHTHHRKVGYVVQEGVLFPHMNVFQNVAYGIGNGKGQTEKEKAHIEKYLKLTGILELKDRFPHELSGGQQQRVALARSLAPMPELLLLDEPFSALDEHLRYQIRDEVIGIIKASGTTAIMVTHDREEAISLSDRIVVLFGGKIMQYGTPKEIYYDSENLSVARFVGELIELEAYYDNGEAFSILGKTKVFNEVPNQSTGRLMIRPELIVLRKTNDQGRLTPVRVKESHFKGPYSHVSLVIDDKDRKEKLLKHNLIKDINEEIVISLRVDNSIELKENEVYYVSVESELKFFPQDKYVLDREKFDEIKES